MTPIPPQTPAEPRTEAGRSRWSGRTNAAADALLDELSESPLPGARYALDVVRRRLPAIEEQAATEARRELLAKVEGLPEMTHDCRHYGCRHETHFSRAAVRRLIEGVTP